MLKERYHQIHGHSRLFAKQIQEAHCSSGVERGLLWRKMVHGGKEALLAVLYFEKYPNDLPADVSIDDIVLRFLFHDCGTCVEGENWWRGQQGEETRNGLSHVSRSVKFFQEAGLQLGIPASNADSIIAQHHERINGKGYPSHLRGDEVSFLGRLAGVIDKLVSSCEGRPYNGSRGKTLVQALAILNQTRDEEFDGQILDKFAALFDSLENVSMRSTAELNPHKGLKWMLSSWA